MRKSEGTGKETLRRELNREDRLRPIDLARIAGLGVTQIRTYERVGFLPPAPRDANGYRRYSSEHVHALRASRALIAGYGWQTALDVMRAIHLDEVSTAFSLVNSRHAALDSQRIRAESALEAIDAMLRRPARAPESTGKPLVHVKEAAASVGVRTSAVRFWESQGLLQPRRQASTNYRLYDADQLTRLNVIALLRDVGYPFDVIRGVLDELTYGRPDQVRHALQQRLQTLQQTTWQCISATSALHTYLLGIKNPRQHGEPTID
jgi:DNA-binding transcriptional MerR regulator